MRDFPADFVNTNAPHVGYTPWHLIEHLRIGQWDILEYVRSGTHVSPKWPDEYWPAKGERTDLAGWTKSLDQFRADREALIELVADPSRDLLAPIPHTPGHTLLREVFLVTGHTGYHLGEFGILREVMQTWPPGHQ